MIGSLLDEDEISMSDTVFCYHCRRHHPLAEVVLIETGKVKRWRCRKSLFLARRSVGERDAFGHAVSELNRSACAAAAMRPLPRPVIELMLRRPLAAEHAS